MPKMSAGLLMYRLREDGPEVFLVHPGGPFWSKKNAGAWSIPKGEYTADEEALTAARREFTEETSFPAEGDFRELGVVKQASGKTIHAWAFEGDCEASRLVSNTCEIEWPPRSGRRLEIPEVDEGRWFPIAAAREHIQSSQAAFLDRLGELLL